MSEKFLEQAL